MLFRVLELQNKNKRRVRLLHIGPYNPSIQDYFNENNMNRTGWYECTGQMEYRTGMELLSSCNVCALEYMYPEGPGTKIFDYICLNKPVIGIVKPGISLEKMLASFDHAYACHSEKEIKDAIEELLSGQIATLIDGADAQETIDLYSRSRQNAIFEKIVKEITDEV